MNVFQSQVCDVMSRNTRNQNTGRRCELSLICSHRFHITDKYPEVKTFGPKIPAYGVWARHVKGLKLKNVTFELKNPDARPEIICEDGDMQIYK